MRRQKIHYRTTPRVRSLASMAGEAHLHCCEGRDCRLVYEDACDEPAVNRRCHTCRGGRRPIWMVARDPQDCCWGNCEQVVDKAEIRRYSLAGPGPWYQCRSCARAHGWPCA